MPAGAGGGHIIAQGTVKSLIQNSNSMIGPFLKTKSSDLSKLDSKHIFDIGKIDLSTSQIHTVKPLEVSFPKGRLTVITGVSGSGKTTMILESLIPALEAKFNKHKLPAHIKNINADTLDLVSIDIKQAYIEVGEITGNTTSEDIIDQIFKKFCLGK